jgi:hypothetical protein
MFFIKSFARGNFLNACTFSVCLKMRESPDLIIYQLFINKINNYDKYQLLTIIIH